MSQQLNEQLLKSDFTFGFELEGCARLSDYGDYNNEYDYSNIVPKVDSIAYLVQYCDNIYNQFLTGQVPAIRVVAGFCMNG